MTAKAISYLSSAIDINHDFPDLMAKANITSFIQASKEDLPYQNLTPVGVIPQFENIHDYMDWIKRVVRQKDSNQEKDGKKQTLIAN